MPLCLKSLPAVSADSAGLLAAVVYAAAMVGMGVCARWSDGRGRHAVCMGASMGVAAVGFGALAVALQRAAAPAVVVCCFCVVAVGLWGVMGPFWVRVCVCFHRPPTPPDPHAR
jgi:hypothetical protein